MDKVNSIKEAAEEIDTFLENLISENFKGLFGEIIKDGDLAWFYRENIKQACIEFNQWQQSQQPEIVHAKKQQAEWQDYLTVAADEGNNDSDEWISVEDRLPELDGNSQIYCLVVDTYNGIVVRPFNEYHLCWDGEDADDYYTDAKGGKITHWQPLPAPPKK